MKPRSLIASAFATLAYMALIGAHAAAQQPQPSPPAPCCGQSGSQGMRHGMAADMPALHQLLLHRDTIQRQVTNLPNGIESVTRSSDPSVAALLKTHVTAMAKRLEEGRPFHLRDPLFAEIFSHARDIKIAIEPIADGVHVTETSDDPYAAKLIQEHAGVVNLFIERGMSEMHRDHTLPAKP